MSPYLFSGNRIRLVLCVTAAAFAVSSCRQHNAPTDRQSASSRLPTATEVFDLRSKCAALGEKIMSENIIGSALTHDQISHYNPDTNHCYVKLAVSSADLTTPQDRFVSNEYLYDGQTKELLAYTSRTGNQKSYSIFSDSLRKFVNEPAGPTYENTGELIERFVAEDRKP